MSKRWYSYDPEQGVTLHHTAAEAKQASLADLEHHRPDVGSGDCWHEDIETLSWGEMIRHGEVRCVGLLPVADGELYERDDWALVRLPETDEVTRRNAAQAMLTVAQVLGALVLWRRCSKRCSPHPELVLAGAPTPEEVT